MVKIFGFVICKALEWDTLQAMFAGVKTLAADNERKYKETLRYAKEMDVLQARHEEELAAAKIEIVQLERELAAAKNEVSDTAAWYEAETERLRAVEAEYKRLTDRDERGRFVRAEETPEKKEEKKDDGDTY